MATVLLEGFEGGLHATSGWIGGTPYTPSTSVKRTTLLGRGGDWSAQFTGGTSFRLFPTNADTNQPLQIREAYIAFAKRRIANNDNWGQFGMSRNGGVWASVNLATAGANLVRAQRGDTILDSATLPLDGTTIYLFQARMFAGGVGAGSITIRSGAGAPLLEVTGVDTAGALPYFTGIYNRVWTAAAWIDDVTVQAPSIRFKNVVTSDRPAINTVLTGLTSGAEVLVSEAELARNRVWVHSWNGVPFIDGEDFQAGSLIAAIDAPNANFVNGFEPNSFWPQGVPFIIAAQPTTNVSTDMTPQPPGSNVDNINQIPEDPNTFNLATSATPEEDAYGGLGLPHWVGEIYAVAPDPYGGSDGGSYTDMTVTLEETTGSQDHTVPLVTTEARSQFTFDLRADNTAWDPSDFPSVVVKYKMEI